MLGCLLGGEPLPDLDGAGVEAAVQSWRAEFLAPFVHARLKRLTGPAPAWVAATIERLRPLRLEAAAREALLTGALERVLDLFADAKIPVMPLKGAELAHRLYRSAELRPQTDLDLWVGGGSAAGSLSLLSPRPAPRNPQPATRNAALAGHFGEAMTLLQAAGWRETDPDPAVRAFHLERGYHVPMIHRDGAVRVELHHRLYPDLPTAAQQEILARAEPGVLLGRPALFPEAADRLIILCSHLATAGLAGAGRWLLDLALLLDPNGLIAPLAPPAPRKLLERAVECDQALYLLVASIALRQRWRVDVLAEIEPALHAELRAPERRLVRQLARRGPRIGKHAILAARRMAGRSVSIPHAWLSSLWCHPGAVCLEMHVRSNDPFFICHRLRHLARRSFAALRALAMR